MVADERTRLHDYRTVFGSDAGKRVLADLQNRFLFVDAREFVAADNTTGVAWIAAHQYLLGLVTKWAEKPVESNMPKFEQPIEQGDPLHG